MKSFEQIVEEYRKKNVQEMISNDSLAHGAVLFDNIFDAALEKKLDVKIVSGSLAKNFYSSFTRKASELLKSNKVDVVLTSPNDNELKDNTFFSAVKLSPKGSVKYLASPGIGHFIVAGDNIYRFELDHDLCKALANFNDKLVGSRLQRDFAELAQLAKPI